MGRCSTFNQRRCRILSTLHYFRTICAWTVTSLWRLSPNAYHRARINAPWPSPSNGHAPCPINAWQPHHHHHHHNHRHRHHDHPLAPPAQTSCQRFPNRYPASKRHAALHRACPKLQAPTMHVATPLRCIAKLCPQLSGAHRLLGEMLRNLIRLRGVFS